MTTHSDRLDTGLAVLYALFWIGVVIGGIIGGLYLLWETGVFMRLLIASGAGIGVFVTIVLVGYVLGYLVTDFRADIQRWMGR